jgi:hypothetical protein
MRHGKGVKGHGRRGFKASANRISVRLRRGQGLPAHAPIDVAVVGARLQIEIVPLSCFSAEFQGMGKSWKGKNGS